MREFSIFEKEIVTLLNDLEKDFEKGFTGLFGVPVELILAALLDESPNLCLTINFNTKDVFIEYPKKFSIEEISPELIVYGRKVMMMIRLLNYLEEKRLIYFEKSYEISLDITEDVKRISWQESWINTHPQSFKADLWSLIEFNYKARILDLSVMYVWASEDLKVLIQNNFKTESQIQHEESIKEAKREAGAAELSANIAILVGIASIVISFIAVAISAADLLQ